MKTQIVSLTRGEDKEALHAKLAQAGEVIKNGGLVAFPTETVYGLGGDALNEESAKKIYAAKGRPSDNPLIVHIADMEHLEKIVREVPENVRKLAKAFWPGPLTMIMKKSDVVPYQTTGGLDTVAVRMPGHPIALIFIRESGGYVAAPSANLSGKPSPTTAKYVIQDMDGRIDMILDAYMGSGTIGIESTIVDMTSEIPMILRPGYITQEMITGIIGKTDTDVTIFDNSSDQAPKAPGMKYRHYAPKGELVIVEGEPEKVVNYINAQAKLHAQNGEKTGVIGTSEMIQKYQADSIKDAGRHDDMLSVAGRLYTFLREFDDENVAYMYSESFSSAGIGQAVMNRLLKAAGHKCIKVN
ncbi:MAG: threonylcarbamoyl-AMP synthase [Lachnospiraceae bacterium]|nr:threonylcarbamoyl-AMP synthase [Lachnospiraceae bacterium]